MNEYLIKWYQCYLEEKNNKIHMVLMKNTFKSKRMAMRFAQAVYDSEDRAIHKDCLKYVKNKE